MPPAQAYAILKVMEMEIAAGHESLASRVDLLDVKSALKVDIADLRAELKAEIHKVEAALSRWVLSCILGQTAVLAGLGYFVLAHFRRYAPRLRFATGGLPRILDGRLQPWRGTRTGKGHCFCDCWT